MIRLRRQFRLSGKIHHMQLGSFRMIALSGGAVLAASLIVRKPKTIQQLISELDLSLVERLSCLAESEANDTILNHHDLWKIDQQARLLIRITIEIAKLYPEKFAAIPSAQKRRLWLLRCASIMNMIDAVSRRISRYKEPLINTAEFARSFMGIFCVTECVIFSSDLFGSDQNLGVDSGQQL